MIDKINFLCVGAQKAGTTSLHDILKQHPDIYLPKSKEAHFFDIDQHYERGLKWWFDTFFSSVNNEKIVGAITPEYFYYEDVPTRILETLGKDIKIIILLRNPVDRAYSHYLMSKRRGYEEYSFEDAVSIESERIKIGDFEKNHFSYITRGLYSEQIKRYQRIFSKENILILRFEDDFINNKEQTIRTILAFLGVDEVSLDIDLKSNQATQPRCKCITRLLNKESGLKKILRLFIKSSKVKIYISQLIDNLNQSEKGIKKLTKNDKKFFLNKFFLDDIKNLENSLKISLSTWYKE